MTQRRITPPPGSSLLPVIENERDVSEETRRKQSRTRRILVTLLNNAEDDERAFVFIDLTAGKGYYNGNNNHGYSGPGSPLIAAEELNKADIPTGLVCFEREQKTRRAMANRVKPIYKEKLVIRKDHNDLEVVTRTIDDIQTDHDSEMGGIAYFDPSRPTHLFPIDTFELLWMNLPNIDFMVHISIGLFSRTNGSPLTGPDMKFDSLLGDINSINKEYMLLHYRSGHLRWVTIYFTNSEKNRDSIDRLFKSPTFPGEGHSDDAARRRLGELCTPSNGRRR
jgi:hypothetical protein